MAEEDTVPSAPDAGERPDSAYGSPDPSEYQTAHGSYYDPNSSSSSGSSSSGSDPLSSGSEPLSASVSTCRPSPCGGSVNILLLADPSSAEYKPLRQTVSTDVAWHAELSLDVADLPALFARGLFWTARDIDPTKSYFYMTPRNAERTRVGAAGLGFPNFRHYELVDGGAAHGDGEGEGRGSPAPLWRGTLRVHARSVRTLREFRPARLTLANVRYVAAKDRQGRWVYRFDSENEDGCFSAITDDEPLQGWWPWPKNRDAQGAMEGNGADDVETVVYGGL